MKLTKGKLSKIRNKKNQSVKRFKKTGKGRKTKTFRNRKALNLHNSSLKKYKGGQGAKLPESTEPVVEPAKPNKVAEIVPTSDVVNEPLVEPAPTSDVVNEPLVEPTESIPTTDVVSSDPGEGPGSHQELPAPVSEVGTDSAEVSPAAKEEMAEEESAPDSGAENGSDAGSEIGSEDAASLSEAQETTPIESVQEEQPLQKTLDNDVSIVAESLDKLAEYISDKIAKKLNLNLRSPSTELNRDSFNAVANANQSLVEA